MSNTLFNASPGWWSELRNGSDRDTRTKSFVGALFGTPETIASVSAVNITRVDGAPFGAGDLTLGGAPVVNAASLPNGLGSPIPAGLAVTVPLVAGTAGGTYNVEIVVVTAPSGNTIGRDTLITVSGRVG